MLDRFKVPKSDEVRVPESSLRETVTAIFEKMGVAPDDAALGADVLISTDLRGVETHGVSNALREYVEAYGEGSLNARPDWKLITESPGTAVMDADNGLAVILGPRAMNIAIEKARTVGLGMVSMFNAGHSGAIGHHAMLAAKADMVGMCTTADSWTGVLPTFASEGRLGTNPIAVAAPANNEPYFLFDAATSSVAVNKLELARRVGANLIPGWIADREGTPIMEETQVKEYGEFYMLPVGGSREQGSHKGYGLSIVTEIFGTLLAGARPSMVENIHGAKHSFIAFNIAMFTEVQTFKENMDAMLRTLRETPPAPGQERVMYPGLSEHEEEQDRRANGIPLHKEVIQWFSDICGELSVPGLKPM
ncbi:MAG: Ldh family oxidoreductase [SAR202 cluster bacterium]|nr:Ldh family oxidoreductase [SAR202 cluster bacterium]